MTGKDKENKTTESNGKGDAAMKAIGYVSGLYVDYEGKIIDCEEQKKRIKAFAEDCGVELVTIYEDMDENKEILDRPGVRQMLAADTDATMVLTERVWCLGRTRAALTPFMNMLDSRGLRLEAVTTCFDVTSQFARFWYYKPAKKAHVAAAASMSKEKTLV